MAQRRSHFAAQLNPTTCSHATDTQTSGVFGRNGEYLPLRSSPTNVLLGVFILWWGWFGFNAGSTGGLSGGLDRVASKAAVNTALGSGGGTLAALVFSYM